MLDLQSKSSNIQRKTKVLPKPSPNIHKKTLNQHHKLPQKQLLPPTFRCSHTTPKHQRQQPTTTIAKQSVTITIERTTTTFARTTIDVTLMNLHLQQQQQTTNATTNSTFTAVTPSIHIILIRNKGTLWDCLLYLKIKHLKRTLYMYVMVFFKWSTKKSRKSFK